MNPFPIILSAPSGGGKTTIARRLLKERHDVGYSVSCTTRLPRQGEVDGRDYYFLSHGEFVARAERGEFAEWADVHGRLYGTLRREVERVLESGRHVIMDIDVQGAQQFTAAFPTTVPIFILPPSAEVLVTRLTERKSEDKASLVRRLHSARMELEAVGRYHYVVVNDDLDRAVASVAAIIDAEAVRHDRVRELDQQVDRLISELQKQIDKYPQP
ncbi:MAG TPA: guanylate kinase [Gemmatimonadaceae bacterium]|nr:guanylate kinase [Gemmatimonadaceae bacterium]